MPNFMAKLKLDPKVYVSALTVDGRLASASGFTSMERNVGPSCAATGWKHWSWMSP